MEEEEKKFEILYLDLNKIAFPLIPMITKLIIFIVKLILFII